MSKKTKKLIGAALILYFIMNRRGSGNTTDTNPTLPPEQNPEANDPQIFVPEKDKASRRVIRRNVSYL